MACATLKRIYEFDPLSSPSGRAAKRRRGCNPVCVLSPSNVKAEVVDSLSSAHSSPFKVVSPKLTSEQIAINIRNEIQKLQKRKQLPRVPPSGNASHIFEPSANAGSTSSTNGILTDQPLFSFRHIGLICQEMLKQRENEIRTEYEKVLSAKLAEQYEAYVKFTHDAIQKRYEKSTPSYLS